VRATGGQDRYALELAARVGLEHDLDLITLRAEGPLPPRVRVRRVLAPHRPMLLAAPLFRIHGGLLARSVPYDVVHTIGGALPGATVITAQFCAAEWRRLDCGAGWYQRLVSAQAVRDERAAYRHPNLAAVIAVSRRTAEEVKRHYGPLTAPVYVIPNGVDLDAFAPPAVPRPPRPRARLLFVGTFERKGLDIAIRALALLRHDAELLAIGGGPARKFLQVAASLGVAHRVRLEPPRADVAAAFRDADALVFPTRYEPFGMVIAEALACGVPVVTSARAGAADLIRDGDSGYVVADPEDAPGFAAAVDRLLEDADALARMRRHARDAVRGLGWDEVAAQTLEVYRAVTGGAPARAPHASSLDPLPLGQRGA